MAGAKKRHMMTAHDTDEGEQVEHDIGPFSHPWEESDVILKVEGHKLHAHANILSMVSDVFKTMFTSGFKESQTKEVDLKEKNLEDVEMMLKAIYPQHQLSLGPLNLAQLKTLLNLSQEYMINTLKIVVENHLSRLLNSLRIESDIFSLAKYFEVLKLAEEGDFHAMVESCAAHIAVLSNGNFVFNPILSIQLSPETLKNYSTVTKLKLCAQLIRVRYQILIKKDHEENAILDEALGSLTAYMSKIR